MADEEAEVVTVVVVMVEEDVDIKVEVVVVIKVVEAVITKEVGVVDIVGVDEVS